MRPSGTATTYREVVRRMGRDGWLGVGWPKEYGGQRVRRRSSSRSSSTRRPAPTCRCRRSRCRPSARRCRRTAPTEQKAHVPARDPRRRRALRDRLHRAGRRHRPRLAAHHARCATATTTSSTARRSSPPAATTPTTSGWPCRTDPDAPAHKGISILIVDTTDPGYSWTPIITCDGAHHVNATYYTDVRVPGGHAGRRGEPGLAADHHPAQPRARHARPGRPDRGPLRPGRATGPRAARTVLERARRAARARPRSARPSGQRAAELAGRGEPTAGDAGSAIADASATKVFASERMQRVGRAARGDRRAATATRPTRRPPS